MEAPGLAAEDVEALVTRPLERALGGAPELATLRSSSIAGLAVLTAIYPYGTDPYRARQVVIERLALDTSAAVDYIARADRVCGCGAGSGPAVRLTP